MPGPGLGSNLSNTAQRNPTDPFVHTEGAKLGFRLAPGDPDLLPEPVPTCRLLLSSALGPWAGRKSRSDTTSMAQAHEPPFPGHSTFFLLLPCVPLGCARWLRCSEALVCQHHPFPAPAAPTSSQQHQLYFPEENTEPSSPQWLLPGTKVLLQGIIPNCPIWEQQQSCAGEKQDGKAVTNPLAPQPCQAAAALPCVHTRALVSL